MRLARCPTRSLALCLGLTLSAAPPARGQEAAEGPRPASFERGAVGIELGIGSYVESWNLNDNGREWLLDGAFAIWWAPVNRATLLVEFHATRVFQASLRHAFATGLVPVLRLQVLDRRAWDLFAEVGLGRSWSDTAVPAGGTRSNYLALAGLGVSRRIARDTSAAVGFRWTHLSNNGREGHDRNPDIQGLGGFGAVTVAF
jgi:hypothetical protein